MADPGTGGTLLRDPDFARFWTGETVSLVGAQVADFSLVLVAIVSLAASPFEIGMLNVARLTPYVLLSLLAGVWFDRHRRRPAMVLSNLGRSLLVGVVPLAALLGVLSIGLMYAVALAMGALTVIFDVGSLSYIPSLVPRRHLTDANSKIQISYSIAGIGGPGLAGLLAGLLTAPIALFVATGSYLFSAATLVLIRRREPPPETPAERAPLVASIVEGLRAVVGGRILRNLAGQSAVFNLFENVVTTLFAVYAIRRLGLTPAQLGLVLGGAAVGALLGAAGSPWTTGRLGFGRTMRASTAVACLSPLMLLLPSGAGSYSLATLTGALAVHGMSLAVFNVNALTLRQSVTPARLLGRMNASYRLVLFGTVPLGALLAGALAGVLGLRTGLAVGVFGLLLPLAWLPLSPVFTLSAIPDPAAGEPATEDPSEPCQTHETTPEPKERDLRHAV